MASKPHTAVNSSASHVFQVLRLVAEAEEPLGVSEIGRRLKLPPSTVYRALTTLEESDYLGRFQNTPRYELGPMPHLLNRALVHRFKLHAASRPVLRALAESTGETVSLTVRLGWYGLRLAGVYGSRDIYHRDRLGEVGLLHENLQGRGILAFLGEDEFARYCAFVERHHPDAAAADWTATKKELATARAAGLAREHLSPGDQLAAVALPIRQQEGETIASLAISGPVHTPGSGDASLEWREACAMLEADINANPAGFTSPFAAIAVDEIVLRLNRPPG